MAEDSTNPFASILGALSSKGGRKGVVKDSDGKVAPHLTPAETARYEKIFGIMKKVVNPGPETGKLDNPTSKVGGTAAMQKVAEKSGSKDFEMPGLSGVFGAIGGAAAVIGAALTTMSEDFIEEIEGYATSFIEFGDNTGDEFGKLGVVAAKLAKFLPIKLLKGLPLIGALFNFGFAFDHFNKGEWFDGGWELVSGLINFLPGGQFISPLMDGYKIYAEVLANKEEQETGEKPTFANILGRQLKAIGTYCMDQIVAGKVPILSTFFKFGEGIGLMIGGDLDGGLEAWSHILPSLLGGKDSPVYKYVSEGLGVLWELTKDGAGVAMDKAGEWAGDAWGWITKVLEPVGEVLKSFFDGIANWFNGAVNGAIDGINKFLPDDWQIPKFGESGPSVEEQRAEMDKRASGRKAFIDSYRARVGEEAFEQGRAAAKASGKMNIDYINQIIADEQAFQAGNQSDWIKGQLAGKTNAEMGYQNPSIKDGIVHQNGRATRIDGNDAGLFAKTGGPIDKMLDQNSAVMKSIQSINTQQLNVLVEIREGIKSLSQSGALSFSNTSLTQEFFE